MRVVSPGCIWNPTWKCGKHWVSALVLSAACWASFWTLRPSAGARDRFAQTGRWSGVCGAGRARDQ